MYLRLTSRCNMKCAHCAYSCTSKGQDMSMATLKLALDIAADYGDSLELGGGEPTLHPKFWQIIGIALSKGFEGPPWLATNGKRTADALALAQLAKTGALAVALSLDQWHEKISPSVVQAFTSKNSVTYRGGYDNPYPNDSREIRTVKEPFRAGRWKAGPRRCACPELVVQPDGTISQCGCMDSPVIGHVKTGIKDDWFTHECWQPEDEKVRAA